MPLKLDGDLNEGWHDKIEDSLTRGFVQAGMGVVTPMQVTAASGGVGDCNNTKCFQFLSNSVEARFLVRATLAVEDRNYTITMDIVDGNDGSMAASSNEACQLCGLSEVGDLVTSQAVALRQKVDTLALEPAVLAVTSDPTGATIFIDGEKIGPTPLEEQLSPGRHEAEIRKKGYLTQTRTIEAVKGVRETVEFELLPDLDADDGSKKDWKVPVGWTSLSLGIAGVAAGVTFLVIDENPYRTRCSGPDVDAFGNCRQRYDTLVHGAVFTGTGGAFLVTGAALLIAARVKGGRRAKEVARRLRVGPGSLGARF